MKPLPTHWLVPVLLITLLVTSCQLQRRIVVVTDAAGRPVSGAHVNGAAPEFQGVVALTDARGRAVIEWSSAEDLEWVEVRKEGYRLEQAPTRKGWPLQVRLAPPEPAQP